MHKAVRELVDKAATIGWSYDRPDGSGHYRLRHESGATYSVPATPGEYRSLKNALAELERIAGRKTQRVVRRRSRKGSEVSGFSLDAAKVESARWHREWGERVEQLHADRDQAIADLREIRGQRRDMDQARRLVATILRCEQELCDMRQPVEPFDPMEMTA